MTNALHSPQWTGFLHNLGTWEGSFTRLSPQGEPLEDTPSRLVLAAQDDNQVIHLDLQLFSPETGEPIRNITETFRSISQTIPFFVTGQFSQGSLQTTPIGRFGAELAMIWGDRRLRIVQQFQDGSLLSHTVIREHRQSTPQPAYPQLTVEQLVGEWQGTALTIDKNGIVLSEGETTLAIAKTDNILHQTLTAPGFQLSSTAQIMGDRLLFEQGKFPVQLLLLPSGGSSNTPLTIPRGQRFVLEAGWLIEPNLRQRLMRNYDDKGGLVSLTLVTEHKLG
jgi:hypothetical protein